MTHAAARQLATGEGDEYAPNMAKALASDAYMSVARQAIQLRGGIGFTWEEDTHLWFKRAKSSEVLLGTSNWHRERMIQRIESSVEVANA
jgi:alkylation response protein AidB-like acyl-CoA dehydrogenase